MSFVFLESHAMFPLTSLGKPWNSLKTKLNIFFRRIHWVYIVQLRFLPCLEYKQLGSPMEPGSACVLCDVISMEYPPVNFQLPWFWLRLSFHAHGRLSITRARACLGVVYQQPKPLAKLSQQSWQFRPHVFAIDGHTACTLDLHVVDSFGISRAHLWAKWW